VPVQLHDVTGKNLVVPDDFRDVRVRHQKSPSKLVTHGFLESIQFFGGSPKSIEVIK
jgi:hypothetical protein